MPAKRKRAETPAQAAADDKVAAPPDAALNGANQATAPANGISHTDGQPQYTPVPRTEAEWQALADAVKERIDAVRARGNHEGAEEYEFRLLRPLLNNVELARKAPNGVHTDTLYDNTQTVLERMWAGYGSRKVGRDTTQAETGIMEVGDSEAPRKLSDTTGSGAEVSTPLPAPVADNNPAKTETAANTNDNVSSPVRTIDNSGANEKFTQFRVGDLLRIPHHHGKFQVFTVVNDVRFSHVYYGFMLTAGDIIGLKHYNEWQIAILNPDVARPRPVIEAEPPVIEAAPAQVDEVPEVTDMKAKIELMEQSLRCVIEAFFAGDLPGVETCFHEFQHDLYRATKRNPSLMTEVKASILMRLQMREPVELPEPVDNSKQKALPNFGESDVAA